MPAETNPPRTAETDPAEGLMFSSTRLWERGQRRRKRPAASRDPAMDAGEPAAASAAEPADSAYETHAFSYEPIRPERPRRALPVGALAGGVAAIAVIAALGWYMNRDAGPGLAELTPGAPEGSQITLAAAPPASPMAASPSAATPAPRATAPAAAPETGTTGASRRVQQPVRASTPRVRPAQAAGAAESGVDASAVAPVIEPPAPAAPKLGPTLDLPPEQVAPSLDPRPPSGASSPPAATTPAAPSAGGEVTTP